VLARVPERLVILPLNVTAPMPAELEPASPAVWSALESYLRAHGPALQTLSVASILDARAEAKGAESGFADAARLFIGRLKQHADFDAVIVPSIFLQRALLSGTTATWDGAEQPLEMIDARNRVAQLPADAPIQGAAPAASLHAVVLDADGAVLQETRAGLALLVRARISRANSPLGEPSFAFIPRRDPFGDRAMLMQGIARALAPFLPPLPAGAQDTTETRDPEVGTAPQ
jgi:hypothetical protein